MGTIGITKISNGGAARLDELRPVPRFGAPERSEPTRGSKAKRRRRKNQKAARRRNR